MTTRISENRRTTRNRIVLGLIAIASVTGLTTTAAPAWAVTTLSSGHVDVVFVDINQAGTKLELGTNDEDGGAVYLGQTAVSDLSFRVNSGTKGAKTAGVWTLLQAEIPALQRGLWAGLAGSENLRGPLTPGTDNIILKLNSLTVPSGGAASLVRNTSSGSTVWFDSAGDQQSFGVSAGSGEAYHQHTEWNFTKAGTYTFTFEARTTKSGITKSDPVTYTFIVQP